VTVAFYSGVAVWGTVDEVAPRGRRGPRERDSGGGVRTGEGADRWGPDTVEGGGGWISLKKKFKSD
jgi:hypothetical protein